MIIECENCERRINQWDTMHGWCPDCIKTLIDERNRCKQQYEQKAALLSLAMFGMRGYKKTSKIERIIK